MSQVGGSDLDELAPRPQPGERPRRVGSAGDDQVQLLGEMLEEEQHRLVYGEGLDHVVVVEHQRHIVAEASHVVGEGADDGLQGAGRRLQGSDFVPPLYSCGDEPALERRLTGFDACSPVWCRSSDTSTRCSPCSEHVDKFETDLNPHGFPRSAW